MVFVRGGPAIRALSRMLLGRVRALPVAKRDDIIAQIPASVLRNIDDAFVTAWISMDDHMALSDAARAVLGPQGNVQLWADTMVSAYGLPLLASFVRTAKERLNLSPAGLYKQGPRIYQHLVRSAGVLSFEPESERSITMTLRAFPAHRYQFICYVEGLHGALIGGMKTFEFEGDVTVGSLDENSGNARYHVNW